MIISPPPITSQFQTYGGEVIRVRTFDLGGWNIEFSNSNSINISPIAWGDVISINAVIVDDSGNVHTVVPGSLQGDSLYYPVRIYGSTAGSSNAVIHVIGSFAGVDYNSTGSTRGFMYVTYKI